MRTPLGSNLAPMLSLVHSSRIKGEDNTHNHPCEESGSDSRQVEAEPKLPTHSTYDGAFKVAFAGDDDPLSPRSMSNLRKWFIVAVVCTSTICVTCTSSIHTTTYTQLTDEFSATRLTLASGLSTFVLGIAIGPSFTGPLSEYYGRRPIYLVSWSMFLLFLIPSTVAQNMNTLIITRFFDGFCGGTFLSVAGGTVSDIFASHEVPKPMTLVSLAPFVGPSVGPLLGGIINFYLPWRWTYYIMLIWASLIFVMILFIPETLHSTILKAKARQLRSETNDPRYWTSKNQRNPSVKKNVLITLLRPLQLLALEPMCLCLSLYSALLLGILYLFFGALPEVFRAIHGFNLWQSGLTFLGIIIGMVIAAATTPIWILLRLRLLQNTKDGTTRESNPEYRLPSTIVGGMFISIGLFWVAWTTQSSIHWIVPIIGSAFFGCGTILIFNGIFTFLVEAYSVYAASALAANNFARALIAAMFPLFQISMYDKLGFRLATTVLAILSVCMLPFPWIFFHYGHILRKRSRFTS